MELSLIFCAVLVQNVFLVCQVSSRVGVGTAASLHKVYTKEFGEACNNHEKCNYRHWLKCVNGFCECTDSSQMIFIDTPRKYLSFFSSRSTLLEKKSCRAKVESRCTRENFLDDDNNYIVAPPLTKPQNWSVPKQTQLCVYNAYCHAHGICKCNLHYVKNLQSGLCDKYKGFSESCEEDEDCHPDQFLKCRRGVCQCPPTLQFAEGAMTDKGAGGKEDDPINRKKLCGAGPAEKCTIRLNLSGKLIHNCQPNATCHLGECKCHEGFVSDYKLKICAPRLLGSECSETLPCYKYNSQLNHKNIDNNNNNNNNRKNEQKADLVCVNSTCVCNSELEFELDVQKKRCVRLDDANGASQMLYNIITFLIILIPSVIINIQHSLLFLGI